MLSILKKSALIGSAGFLMISNSLAGDGSVELPEYNSNTSHFLTHTYVDFSATSPYANHQAWKTFTSEDVGAPLGAKYYMLHLYSNSSTGVCYEVWTDLYSSKTKDPIIYVNNDGGGGPRMMLGNNISGTDKNAKVRVWIKADWQNGHLVDIAWINLFVAANGTGNNGMDFYLHTDRVNLSESACNPSTGTVPWAKVIGANLSFSSYHN
ncbi:MAG TPA: hypothetical protein VJ385_00015 [Fibrobacteria bacterium]|nr:hypothetical protein [Fibrobacteria bacterium]